MTSVTEKRVFKIQKYQPLLFKTSFITCMSLMMGFTNLSAAKAQTISLDIPELQISQVNNYVSQRSFSLNVIWRYAAALQEINPIREKHNRHINNLLGKNRPKRVCYHQPIPNSVQKSCKSFGSKMFQILQKHNIHDIYTPISLQVKKDEGLKRKIQKAGICQQKRIAFKDCF